MRASPSRRPFEVPSPTYPSHTHLLDVVKTDARLNGEQHHLVPPRRYRLARRVCRNAGHTLRLQWVQLQATAIGLLARPPVLVHEVQDVRHLVPSRDKRGKSRSQVKQVHSLVKSNQMLEKLEVPQLFPLHLRQAVVIAVVLVRFVRLRLRETRANNTGPYPCMFTGMIVRRY